MNEKNYKKDLFKLFFESGFHPVQAKKLAYETLRLSKDLSFFQNEFVKQSFVMPKYSDKYKTGGIVPPAGSPGEMVSVNDIQEIKPDQKGIIEIKFDSKEICNIGDVEAVKKLGININQD